MVSNRVVTCVSVAPKRVSLFEPMGVNSFMVHSFPFRLHLPFPAPSVPRAPSRTFQKDSATESFSRWAKEGDEFEQRFKDFPVAFQHPHHGHPIFNLSDPPHLWKKLVNALWYSDLPWKSRNLARVCCDPEIGEYDLVEFSLKTLERVWYNEERGGGKFSLAEEAAQLTKYTKVNVQQFDRDSYNCMSVPLAVKVGRYIRAIRVLRSDLPRCLESASVRCVCW